MLHQKHKSLLLLLFQHVVKVARISIEKAPLDALEEQSPTVTIKGIVGELAPKERLLKHGAILRKAQALLL